MFKPICREKNLIIPKNSNSTRALVCCWDIKESHNIEEYAVIGNLYSINGIDLVIRNLLANPHINELHILGNDISGAGFELYEFFSNGIIDDGDKWKICSPFGFINSYIKKDIWEEDLNKLRNSMYVKLNSTGMNGVLEYKAQKINRGIAIYPEPPPKIQKVEYKENINTLIEAETIKEAWIKILNNIMLYGRTIDTHYGNKTKEILNLVTVVKSNKMNEYDFYDLSCTKKELEDYVPRVLTNTKYDNCKYTYGNRLRDFNGIDQIQAVIDKLKNDTTTKGAVMSLWRESDVEAEHGTPCLNHVWVRAIGGKLSITALLRSNDMFRAWPLNVYAIGELQKHICEKVGNLELGDITTISESAHIYEDCWKEAGEVRTSHSVSVRDSRDPKGNFLIDVVDGYITVTHMYNNEIVNSYKDTHPSYIINEMINCIGTIEHALYLGRELERAYKSIEEKYVYIQDGEILNE